MSTTRESISKNISAIIDASGLSKKEFADKFGVSKAAVTNWTSGLNSPDIEIIVKISKEYDVPVSSILGANSGILDIASDSDDSQFLDVPVYGSIAAGIPIEMIEVEEYFPVPTKIADKYHDPFLLRVKGESMNRRIPNGSLALIDPHEKDVTDNGPYALCVNGYDATIKRVHKLNNGWQLLPDSYDPTFMPKIYNYNEPETEEITIIGKVVWIVFPFDYEI